MSETLSLHFANSEERDRFEALKEERPEIELFLQEGVMQAETHLVTLILSGKMGTTDLMIKRSIAVFMTKARQTIRKMPDANRWQDEEMFAFRLGFEGTAFEAKRQFLEASGRR